MDWHKYIDDFGHRLLEELHELPDCLPDSYNPISEALAEGDFVERFGGMPGFSRIAVSKIATICQMVVFDAQGGPEGDCKPKALRRHWYAWYKTRFAQPFAQQLGDTTRNAEGRLEMKDLAWSSRLSGTYAWFVDGGEITYKDLWVEDASRMMELIYDRLFADCHIIVAVEKDSLFADFVIPAKALGARTVYSGKGKSSKAAIEKVLRDHYGWGGDYWGETVFTKDSPLIILHISDYDYDGEKVIGPTFGDQASRYTGYILEARVGVQPAHVVNAGIPLDTRWYQVKTSNKAYIAWAWQKALFLAECWEDCGNTWPVVGAKEEWDGERRTATHVCPKCGRRAKLFHRSTVPYGLEVEALRTRDYYGLIVDALLTVLPFAYIVAKLREMCIADLEIAAHTVAGIVYADNFDYQEMLSEFDRLEAIKTAFEEKIEAKIRAWGEPHVSDWENEEDDPVPSDFRGHVQTANDWTGPWRPFSIERRTAKLAQWLEDNRDDELDDMCSESIEWREEGD